MLTYALSDIHGELQLLDRALEWIDRDAVGRSHRVVFCGDYIDRGPNSRGVLDRMMETPLAHQERVFLRGNHDDMMLQSLIHRSKLHEDIWLRHGGVGTLAEYTEDGQLDKAALARHCTFIERMPFFFEDAHAVYTHAGLIGSASVTDHTPFELMWTEWKTVAEHWPADGRDKLLVHGHTPQKGRQPFWQQGRICLDTAACFGGALTVMMHDPECEHISFKQCAQRRDGGYRRFRI